MRADVVAEGVVFGMSKRNFQDSSTMNIETACSARIIRNETELSSAEDYVKIT